MFRLSLSKVISSASDDGVLGKEEEEEELGNFGWPILSRLLFTTDSTRPSRRADAVADFTGRGILLRAAGMGATIAQLILFKSVREFH
jgi:hypothetical protein